MVGRDRDRVSTAGRHNGHLKARVDQRLDRLCQEIERFVCATPTVVIIARQHDVALESGYAAELQCGEIGDLGCEGRGFRDAAHPAAMHADILAYSRSRGIFAGISLEGATLRPDNDENRDLYGSNATSQDILHGRLKPPAAAEQLYAELNRYPSKNTARYK